jgi:hypothetical protein
MDADRILMRASPFAGLGALSWLAYRMMTARFFRLTDLVPIATLAVVLYEPPFDRACARADG